MTSGGRAARTVVLCADGTCNAFGHSSSNVARLLRHIALGEGQVACYDQGVGTLQRERRGIEAFRATLADPSALALLPAPSDRWSRPWTWWSRVAAMTHGRGLDVNVGQLYGALAVRYASGDRVFMFGFSRGAFTVRALAGLVWGYGLPATADAGAAAARFAEAWPLFAGEYARHDGSGAARAREFVERHGQRPCPVHFLGLWDTVKSYGGIRPVMLPRLRHNPSVATVRHALALDERRGWFEATTWGWLDSDRRADPPSASHRLPDDVKARLGDQDVAEVWFTGSHPDVGGGAGHERSSEIAHRWMLGEARVAGLALNPAGLAFLAQDDPPPVAVPTRGLLWRAVEMKARHRIDNSGEWPRSVPGARGASPREPAVSARGGTVWHHATVTAHPMLADLPGGVVLRPRPTVRP